jgi:hypothetical protein
MSQNDSLPSDSTSHPVWDVYDEMRTARLNVKCLSAEIAILERRSRYIEVILAIAGASSIGAVSFLQNPTGKIIWGAIGFLAMILTALKPVFPFSDKRIKKERLLTSYRILEHDLYCVGIGIKERRAYDVQAKREFRSALVRKSAIMMHAEGSCPASIIARSRIEVNRELPVGKFYVPK